MIMPDGSVLNEGTRPPKLESLTQINQRQFGPTKARIIKTLYVDDPDNTSKNKGYPQLQYNVVLLDGVNKGVVIYNVEDSTTQNGMNNISETVRHASTQFQPQTDAQKDWRHDDGDIVLVQNMGGSLTNPVIVGACQHPKYKSTATKDKGEQSIQEFNGVRISTDKNGGMTITNTGGPKDANGNPTIPEAAGSTIGVGADGSLAMSRGDQKVEVDKDGQITMKGPDGTEMGLKSGGQSLMKSTSMDLQATQAFNVKSALTQIGQSGVPSARIGDMVIGTGNQGAPVISKIINGSFISLIGS